ncbi:MAG: ABC transporter substrate-binding protein, partial [Pseudomonadota bacterium]
YTIRLKKGVFFADDPCFKKTNGKGRELTAHDFIYSMKRLLTSPKTKNHFISNVLTDIVVGMDEFRTNPKTENIEGMRAIDNYTIQFKLKKPSAFFPTILVRPNAFVVAREAVEYYGKDFQRHPVGSGAFMIKEWNKEAIVFVRNPNYRHGTYPTEGAPEDKKNGLLDDAGKPLPFLNGIKRYILVEEQPRWINFKQGMLDIVDLDKDSYYDAFPTGGELSAELKNKGVKVVKLQRLETTYYVFNVENKTVSNKYLRQAISVAYDGKKHNALFFNNQAFVANWILPPGIFGFDPAYKNPYRQYDIEKAKKLLAKAGYPNGKGLAPIRLLITDSIAAKQIGEFFVKSMNDIGVKVELVPMDFSELLDEVETSRKFDVAALQWRADLPVPEDFLRMFHSKAFTPGPNDSHFKNAEYDQLFDRISQMSPGPEKIKLLKKIRDIAVEECAVIPLVNPVTVKLVQPYVENYKPQVIVGDVYKYVKINARKKKSFVP